MLIKNTSISLLLITFISLIHITCDDRTTELENTDNFTLTIKSNPVSEFLSVGEDVAGSEAETEIIITLLDAEKNPVKDAIISVSAVRGSQTSGDINNSPKTDKQGQATVYFYDSGVAVDDPSTGEYEGVTITAVYGSQTAKNYFNVYKDKQTVWPYQMTLTTNNSQIQLDNGTTFSNINIKLTNQLNSEVKNANVTITTDKGIVVNQTTGLVINQVTLDSTGVGNIKFKDRNMQSDIGTANIVYSYYHPGFDDYTIDTIKILIGTDYNIAITSTPVSMSSNMGEVVVGEDIVGEISRTRLSVEVTDANGTPKPGVTVPMKAYVLGQEVDSLILISTVTNNSGKFFAYFEDNNVVYQDNIATLDYEGVTVTAFLGDSTGASISEMFEVLPTSVWPYQIFLSSDVDEISLDNGETVATIEAKVLNQLNIPVKNLSISFSSDKGYIESQGITDSSGTVTVVFEDQGEQSDVGLANIVGTFDHPGFGATINDSLQVAITTSYELTLESYPVASDGSGNYVLVGEDVAGDSSATRLVATVTDESGNPVSGQTISIIGEVLDQVVDSIYATTNNQGKVYTYFRDGGNVYQDVTGTPDYEGVIVTAYIGDETGENESVSFSVFPTTVWPYVLYLSTDVDEITLDNGETTATVTGQLLNQLNNPVQNVTISFSSDKGYVDPEATTDENGSLTVTFEDQGEQSDVGLANIVGTFDHPGFGATINDSLQVAITTSYELTLESYPVASDGSGNYVLVGEDVAGDSSATRLVATVTDESGNPVSGQTVSFTAKVFDQTVGNFQMGSGTTNNQGKIFDYFYDGGNVYQDVTGTPDYEGVIVTAYIGDETGENESVSFSVFPTTVWPYVLYLSTDVDEITLDNGETTATVTGQLLNQLNNPVQNVTISFSSDKGYVDPEVTTDSTGIVSLIFSDNGEQDDIGLANISSSFYHPGFNEIIMDSVFVTIQTSNTLQLSYYPIAYDDNSAIVIVGEDIEGTTAYTMLVATVLNADGTNPVSGVPVNFQAISGNSEVGSITVVSNVSDADGQVIGIFSDDGVYQDNPGTPNFEGITINAGFSESTDASVSFNVYSGADVWPYNIIISTNTDAIQLDNGETQAIITCRLLNNMGIPIINGQIDYQCSLGYIESSGLTDSTGIDSVVFTDLGDPDDVGNSNIQASFIHPGFASEVISDSLQIFIEDPSFQTCAFMELPSSIPGSIVVRDGGGIEATSIVAEVYDDNGNLINTPTPVEFRMVPLIGDAYLETPGQTTATSYTVNGVATVSINSGTTPGPVRIEATCDCDQDGDVDLTVIDVPVIISSGPPYHIEAEYDPNATEAIGGGFYKTEIAAIVSDIWHNPVEDSTYVYWSINPLPPDTIIDAFVEGVSFTNNTGINGGPEEGVAFSHIVYSTDAIGEIGRVRALTWGGDSLLNATVGDSIYSYINEGEGDAPLFFLPGEVTLMSNIAYHDFTLPSPTEYVDVEIAALVIDYYGNAVSNAPVAFGGIGMSEWKEVWYELYEDDGIAFPNGTAGAGDSCFTWRDYGIDDDPETVDWGHFNNDHDAWDTTGNGEIDYSEISEVFYDFGLDGIEGTFDEGEGNGEWDGYHMINCEQVVNTDSDGYARIKARFLNSLCIWQSTDPETELCTFEDFTAQITATLLIPQITSATPIEIQLTRSQTDDCP